MQSARAGERPRSANTPAATSEAMTVATAGSVHGCGRYRVRVPRPWPRASMLSASVTASSIPVSRTGTASAGSDRKRVVAMPRSACASRTRCTDAIVRGAIDSASAAASAGSWNRRGASRTTPNGSVTALNVPNTTRIVARRMPSSAAYATLPASTVPKNTSACGSTSRRPRRSGTRGTNARSGPARGMRRVDEPGDGDDHGNR